MNRLPLVFIVVCAGSACCYIPTFEADGGTTTGSNGTTSGSSNGSGSTSGSGSSSRGSSPAASGSSTSGGSSGSSSGQCEVPAAGACSSDSDCVLAYCAQDACNCGGWVVSTSQLGTNACLIEEGATVPAGCQPQGPPCGCPAHPTCTPQCDAGTCACELTCGNGEALCNGECTDTSGDTANCGSCGNVCPGGRECLNGACSGGSNDGGCGTDNFCACMNFCVSTCRCGDGGCPFTQACDGAVCPNSCPSGQACVGQPGNVSRCSPLCTPAGIAEQGSCPAGMTCQTECT